MGSNPNVQDRSLHQIVPEEIGSGDNNGPSTEYVGCSGSLIHEMGGSAGIMSTGQYSFLQRLIIAMVLFIAVLFVSTQLTWITFLCDVAKPVYFVYVGGIAIMEFLAPALMKLDALLTTSIENTSTEEEQLGNIEQAPSAVPDVLLAAVIPKNSFNVAARRSFIPTTAHRQQPPLINLTNDIEEINNVDEPEFHDSSTGTQEEVTVPQWSSSTCVNTNHVKAKNRSGIPAPLNKGRKVKSRGRTAGQTETNTKLLRALESELRKEIKLTKDVTSGIK